MGHQLNHPPSPAPSSLYGKVADDLRAAIAAGTYGPGSRLPSESDLATQYGVSRGTVRQAFAALRADGVISSRRGARRVVLGGSLLQGFSELVSFARWARSIGEKPAGRLVNLTRREATVEEARRLGLPDGTWIYHVTRVRLLSGRPVMLERTTYPERVGSLVADMDGNEESITDRLQEVGVIFADAEHIIDAVPASAEDARLLGVRPRVPLLRERRRSTDPAGQPMEWSEDRYLADVVAFTVHNSVSSNALSRLPRTD